MGKVLKILLASAALLAFLATGMYYWLNFELVPEPELTGSLRQGEMTLDGRHRNYTYYVPPVLSKRPALVMAFHSSGGSAEQSRAMFGYAFEQLADQHGFIVLYPEGYEKHFNGCRKAGPYQANILQIDDVAFMRALVKVFEDQAHIDPGSVFATGVSNGGQMALRLAFEAPDLVAAVAPIATSNPENNNMDCQPSGEAVALLLMNGTDDPMNPYEGGTVALYGLVGNRGEVISSEDTAAYWAELAGHKQAATLADRPDTVAHDNSTVSVKGWQQPGLKPVMLYSIVGGGHSAPHPQLRLPRALGGSNQDIVAAEEIWHFFDLARQQ